MSNSVTKIIQNTGFLYARMLITMGIMLYTSRVLLAELGASDYGLYHVLAGIVVLMGFLQGSLSSTTQRFIAVELGRNEIKQLSNIFSMSVNLHIVFALSIGSIALLVGYTWLLDIINYGTNEPSTVLIVFSFSIATFMMNLLALPCHAVVIAHEHMKAFAWFGITEAVLKLVIVLLLPFVAIDALLAYSALLFLVSFVMTILYFLFVWRFFPLLRYRFFWDSDWFRTLFSFSGWTLWGSAATVFANQGTNLLLNIFFGPALNAAKSIGTQASGALNQFVTNLQSAINPQLIKSYSADDTGYTDKLIYHGAKYNFFLIAFLALPVITYTDEILNLWLVEVPDYAALFLKILLATVMLESVSRPLITAAQATGHIKLYQFVVGGILLLNVPISFIALHFGADPEWVFYIALMLVVAAGCARIVMLKRIYDFSAKRFLRQVVIPIIKVSALLWVVSKLIKMSFPTATFIQLFGSLVLLTLSTLLIVFFIGLASREKLAVYGLIKKLKKKGQ